MLAFLGILSGIVFIVGDLPYIRDILKGTTKPHRVSWLVFFVLDAIYVANQLALGATNSLWLVLTWTLIAFFIFLLSIKHGVGGFSRFDIFCLTGAVAGLLLWVLLQNPTASLFCSLFVTMIAFVPTLKKSYLQPATETKISWLTAALSGLLAAISVGAWEYKLLILPIMSFLASAAIYATLVLRSDYKAN
jgi:hypothetical protein